MTPLERLPDDEYEQLTIPYADPVVRFCVDGIRLSLSQSVMTREQAVEKIRSWYPGAEILLDENEKTV